jgi:Pentapeptide repeats (8 copies)
MDHAIQRKPTPYLGICTAQILDHRWCDHCRLGASRSPNSPTRSYNCLGWGGSVQAISTPQAKAAAINAVQRTLLTTTAGTLALIALAFTARTYYLSRSGQVATRFTGAAAMLASDKPDERIAGIYAMESIMVQSERDHNIVVEVLGAFIRNRASTAGRPVPLLRKPGELISQAENIVQPSAPADIEAALYVLGKRPRRPERQTIDLNGSDLRGMNLSGLNFARASFLGTWMHDAFMVNTDLRGAWLFAMMPSWNAVGERSFTPIQAQGITAIQIGNCII